MTVVGYALEEAWLSLRRSGRSALVSIGTIAIAFTTLGGFLLISVNVQDVLDRWLEAAEMSIYLHDTASEEDRLALEQFLRAQPAVAEVEYVSRERALERFRNDFPELRDVTTGIGENPFPSAFEVRLRAGNGGDAEADSLSSEVAGKPGVSDIRYDRRWLARLNAAITFVRSIGLVIVVLLAVASALTVASVVRLAAHARRDEIEIMQLVGAPLTYVRGPLVLEGVLQGGAGACVAIVGLSVLFALGRAKYGASVSEAVGLGAITFLPVELSLILLFGGMLLGSLGGLIVARAVR